MLLNATHTYCYQVTVSVSQSTSAIFVLSQLDTRYFQGVENSYKFSLNFIVFKAGEKEAIASSYHDALWRRSVNVEIDLEAGDYVVQVSNEIMYLRLSVNARKQVKVDREPPSTVPYTPAPTPVPNPNDPTLPAPYPVTSVPLPYVTMVDSRKKTQKKTELLVSASVAASKSDYISKFTALIIFSRLPTQVCWSDLAQRIKS